MTRILLQGMIVLLSVIQSSVSGTGPCCKKDETYPESVRDDQNGDALEFFMYDPTDFCVCGRIDTGRSFVENQYFVMF